MMSGGRNLKSAERRDFFHGGAAVFHFVMRVFLVFAFRAMAVSFIRNSDDWNYALNKRA
jgi:hypothetical protein